MRTFVRLRGPDGTLFTLTHGDLIGRLGTAALHLDDARVSEAHAMVSLRGHDLRLLALRGRFAIDGKPLKELILEGGQRIEFARGLVIVVEDVVLPDEVLAIAIDGGEPHLLMGVTSLVVEPLRAVPGYREGAAAIIWNRDDRWRVRWAGGPVADLGPGDRLEVAGSTVAAVPIRLSAVAPAATQLRGAVAGPVHIVSSYDTVVVRRVGEPPVTIGGIPGRILAELVAFGGPVEWEVLAGEVWPHESTRHRLRRRLDVALARLRRKLEQGRVRPDLVHADGSGKLQLLLAEGDVAEDRG